MSDVKKTSLPAWLGGGLLWTLCLLPATVLAFFLWRDAVNVPFWDEWDKDIGGIFVKLGHGQLAISDLWAQHNESRMVVLRLVLLMLGKPTHWNVLIEMGITFSLACGVAVALFTLGRWTFPDRKAAHWPVFFLSSLMLFSPEQSEAWLWGMEFVLYVPLACLVASLVVHGSKLADWKKFLVAGGLATVSTYAFSNGLLVWLVLFPIFFLTDGWRGLWRQKLSAAGWLAGLLVNSLLYFHDYQAPSTSQFFQLALAYPLRVLQYFFAFLGGSLSSLGQSVIMSDNTGGLTIATILGGVLFLAFILCLLCAFRCRNDADLMKRAWPWLTIGGYSILSAVMATVGRSLMFGADQALSPRYGIFGICLMLALTHLVPLLAFHQSPASSPKKPVAYGTETALSVLGCILAVFFFLIWPPQLFDMDMTRLDRLQAKSYLDFIRLIPERLPMQKLLFPNYSQLERTALALDELGVFARPLLTTNRLDIFQMTELASNRFCGKFEVCQQLQASNFSLSGWAVSAFHSGPADCVLLTYENAAAGPVVFDLMGRRNLRPDMVDKMHDQHFMVTGWQSVCDFSGLPKGELKIRAWAYDVERRAVAPLQTEFVIKNK